MKAKIFIASLCVMSLVGCGENALVNEQASTSSTSAESSLIAPAEIVSLQQITIGPPNVRRMWQFKIEYIANENVPVKKGDVLVRFDGQKLRNDLVGRESNLNAALKEREKTVIKDEASLQDLILSQAEAQKNYDIAKRKVAITDVSRSEIERKKQQAEYEITAAELAQSKQKLSQHKNVMQINLEVEDAKVANAQTRVNEIKNSLDKMTLYAPEDGMVSLITDWDDNKPTVGETVWMGRALIDLPSLEKLAVKVEIDEADAATVQVNQAVRVVLDDHPEKAFTGIVTQLGKTFRTKSKQNLKVVVDAWVTLDELDSTIMRPGMKANVEFI